MRKLIAPRVQKYLIFFFAGLLCYSIAHFSYIKWQYRQADQLYNQALADYFQDPAPIPASPGMMEPTNEPSASIEKPFDPATVDLKSLKKINPDIFGWIWLPNTAICYPLLKGEDNEKYLNYTYNLQHLPAGSIFLDYRNNSDLTDDNTIIYGHNMKNGSMFAGLRFFTSKDYLRQHQNIFIFTEGFLYHYRVFAAYTTDTNSNTYIISLTEDLTFTDLIADLSDKATTYHSLPTEKAPLLTLSTCVANEKTQRFVIHGVLENIKETL